jgi:polyketide synthase PksJ
MVEDNSYEDCPSTDIAIIGMSCRFPGANSLDEFWKNLLEGKETIQRFTKEELLSHGETAERIQRDNYVNARGIVENPELFDAAFFGFSASDAKILDPQQRLFMECGWEALEVSGYSSEKFKGLIGVYASMAESMYLQNNILKNRDIMQSLDPLQARISTSLTTLSTQFSYRLNLQGPSINLSCACSSSLVVVASACKALLDYDCDLAVAGASVISIPQKQGYLHQKGGIDSADGHCRAFDADATGTVFSDGVGVVILKRLSEAIHDHDHIYAVIKGWNINNDGSEKIGFTAPSVQGQARCIISAANFADVDLESLSYIETHGTGTAMGDPIEINAMKLAFETQTSKKQFCAIGSVKTNIGHADIAAGMASIIKTALSLKNKKLPASLHYKKSNPAIDFNQTPFYVNDKLTTWEPIHYPKRRAGINASGIGGTNAFLVLEEPSHKTTTSSTTTYPLLLLSAKTQTSLEQSCENLLTFIKDKSDQINLSDVAFTLQSKTDFDFRQAIILNQHMPSDSFQALLPTGILLNKTHRVVGNPRTVFLFSGQGSQYFGMCGDLYHSESEFSGLVDQCLDYLDAGIKDDVRSLLLGIDNHSSRLDNTLIIQPALFIFEYALGVLFINMGIIPDAMIGHSLGEYVAACLAEVIDCKTALNLIQIRARLMSNTKPGSMLAISLNEEDVLKYAKENDVCIAASNSQFNTVVSGATEAIDVLEKKLIADNIGAIRLKTSHAFHSSMMEPILEEFISAIEEINFKHPSIPFLSNVTGEWINDHEATNPKYWADHLRSTVRFADSLEQLINGGFNVFIEIGPGNTLTTFVKEVAKNNPKTFMLNTNNRHSAAQSNSVQFLQVIAELWLHGLKVDWNYVNKENSLSRIPIPTYPFNKQRFWISPSSPEENLLHYEKQPYAHWFYEMSWQRTSFNEANFFNLKNNKCSWIIFADQFGHGDRLQEVLLHSDQMVFKVSYGKKFTQLSLSEYSMDGANKGHYRLLFDAILPQTKLPLHIINLLALTDSHDFYDKNDIDRSIDYCFYSPLWITQTLVEKQYTNPINIMLVGNNIFSLLGEKVYPAKSTLVGPTRIIPLEHSHIKIKTIDVTLTDLSSDQQPNLLQNLISDTLNIQPEENIVVYRNKYRWIQNFSKIQLKNKTNLSLRDNGVFLLTGGLGGISLTLAAQITNHAKNPSFILVSRSKFPEKEKWDGWIKKHGAHDSTSKKIQTLNNIEKKGGRLYFYQANIADENSLPSIIDTIKLTFGAISGVIHSAGNPGGGLAQFKTHDQASKVFEPKIYGTYLICDLLKNEPLDFFVLCSSISSIVGEASQIDYCAANACLDAFPYSGLFENSKTLFTTINWNTWQDVGMAVETARPTDISYFDRNNDIKPSEGAKIFFDALSNGQKQMIISTMPLTQFIHQMRLQATGEYELPDLLHRSNVLPEDLTYQAPRNETERQLVKIWQEIFSIDKIGIIDDFFALGGHSLTALQLLNKIERQLHVTISVSTFLEKATTIEQLAQMIASASNVSEPSSTVVIPIRSTGSKKPLFCFHPVAGSVFCYFQLAKYLKYDAPIYGIQDPSLSQEKLLFDTLEDMATAYIKEIKKIQPHGPYYLGGLSFGATLAAEVARQLSVAGETTKMLLFFDGWAKFSNSHNIENIFKQSIEQLYGKRPDSKKLTELTWQRMRLLLNYQIKPIQETVYLFKAQTLLPEYVDIDNPCNYWKDHVKDNINIYKVPGDHETILDEPNIKILAELLDQIFMEL